MDSETIILKKINAVYFQVYCTFGQNIELKEFFSCYAPNYKWSPRFKNHWWDGKISFYESRTHLLPIGLLPNFFRFCKNFKYQYQFDFDINELSNQIEQNELNNFYQQIYSKKELIPKDCGVRDYQNICILKALQNKRGVFEVGTGGGKSNSIYAISRFLNLMKKNILIIVPSINLVEQLYGDFSEYGWIGIQKDVDKLYSRYNNEIKNRELKSTVISTWQSLYERPLNFFKQFDAVIVDEAHFSKCTSIQKILKACTNAEYRLGFTGTLPEEKAELYTIHGFLGPTLFSINSGELIKRGVLSKIVIANIILKYPEKDVKECYGRDYNFEIDYIMNHPSRNKILNYILDNTPDSNNTLILVSRIEKHLKPLIKYLNKHYPKKEIHIIYGQVDALEREKIRAKMERTNGLILLATYQTLSIGFNVKNLHQIIFFSSYKAKIKVLQSIGRGLRTHENKEQLIVFDIVDDFSYKTRNGTTHFNYLVKHFMQRKNYYDKQGFKYQNKIIRL